MTIRRTYQKFIPELQLFALRLAKKYPLIQKVTFYAASDLPKVKYMLIYEIPDDVKCERKCIIQDDEPLPEYWRSLNDLANDWMPWIQEPGESLPDELVIEESQYVLYDIAKQEIPSADIQREASEQDYDIFIKEGDDTASNIFRQTGPTWEIVYNNKTPLRGLRGKGFGYIHFLVKHPKKEYHTDSLAIEVDKIDPDSLDKLIKSTTDNTDNNEYYDQKKMGADHRDMVYGESKDEIKKELEDLTKHYYKLFRPGGKSRKFVDNTTKNKNRIYKSIDRALDVIKTHDKDTWKHFSITLNPIHSYYLSYTPDRNINWLTE